MSQNDLINPSFMELAIELATRGRGSVAPNPCVGAVITKGEHILGQGWHRQYGGDHAEVDAIKDALDRGNDIEGATLWVTLEPCNHYGKTPPCTHAILKHKIKRVIVGTKDPNPRVKGGGIDFLRSHGVEVIVGVKQRQCENLIQDFLTWTREERPYIYLKLAQSLDGKIATREGDSKWISCDRSRRFVHELRSKVGAVLIGGNTFYKDDPKLTVRLKGYGDRQPLAIVVTSRLPKTSEYYLIKSRANQTMFWTKNRDEEKINFLRTKGIEVWTGYGQNGRLDLVPLFKRLFREKRVYYVLCEGGSILANTLVRYGLVNELFLFIAPIILGDEYAKSSFSGGVTPKIKDSFKFEIMNVKQIDSDILINLLQKRQT